MARPKSDNRKLSLGPRISPQAMIFLEGNFSSANAGAQYLIESAVVLHRQVLRGLKGRFQPGELLLLLDVLNGTWLEPAFAGRHLAANAEDAINLDGAAVKWEIDGAVLLGKLSRLHLCELFALEIWARAFWEQDTLSPEIWIQSLTSSESSSTGTPG